jgi:hypothetical protein
MRGGLVGGLGGSCSDFAAITENRAAVGVGGKFDSRMGWWKAA